MGGGSGGGISSVSGSLHSNISNLLARYPHGKDGRLGVPGKNGKANRRVLYDSKPHTYSKELFQKLATGAARVEPLTGKSGFQAFFHDGSNVIWRPISKSGSPAIDLHLSGKHTDTYRIHFEPKKD